MDITLNYGAELNPDRLQASPQFANGRFRNPTHPMDRSIMDNLRIIWSFMTVKNQQLPSAPLPRTALDLTAFNTPAPKSLNTSWIGHSTLFIQVDGYRIITDPVLEKRVSIMGPSRFTPMPGHALDQISQVDAVIISHNHYDHLNRYSIEQLTPMTRQFLVPLGVGKILVKWGVPREKISELDWWEEITVDGLTLTATPTQHFSGRTPFDRNASLWCSWVIRTNDHTLFFSGDSAYFDGFKTIGEKFGPFDMTFLECGSYNEMWGDVHMFPEETVQAHMDLGGKLLHPIHWGTFNLALHPWYDPMVRLSRAAAERGIPLATPVAGQTLVPESGERGYAWWQTHPDLSKPDSDALARAE